MLKLLQSLEPGSRSQIERLGDRQTSLHGATSSSSEKPPALLGNNCCDPIGAHSCFEFSCSSGTCRSGLVIRSWMRGHPHQLVLCKRQVVPAVCLTFACQQHTQYGAATHPMQCREQDCTRRADVSCGLSNQQSGDALLCPSVEGGPRTRRHSWHCSAQASYSSC